MLTLLAMSGWALGLSVMGFFLVCLILILTVLIQRPQGGGLSGAFGSAAGSGQTAFGAKTGDALTIFTIGIFVVYIAAAVGLNFALTPTKADAAQPTAGATSTPGTPASGTPATPTPAAPTPETPFGAGPIQISPTPVQVNPAPAADPAAAPASSPAPAETPATQPPATPPAQPAPTPTPAP